MVEKRLELEPEVQEIFRLMDSGDNFLLSGGAGSGKTHSLVQVIRQTILENPTAKIACITYTNAAVKEVDERVDHKNLTVSTIHDFLWDIIKPFKKELKTSLINLMNEEGSGIKNPEDDPVTDSYFEALENGIQYKEYLKIKDGIISHDEVLVLANYMFKTYPKLCTILKDKFRFIFIDEYQDTSKSVIEILLVHLKQSPKQTIIGFFGDAMQSIYDDTIGELGEYKGTETGKVKEVKKTQNRRNPRLIIELANKLRTDGIVQVPSADTHAPNMNGHAIKDGDIKFYYSTNKNLESIKLKTGWDFTNEKETKILNLTHNLIAPSAGFDQLMKVYDKDPVIGLKKDILAKIKSNKKAGKPEIIINEADTFDQVVDKFQLVNKHKQAKKDAILGDATNSALYAELKDLPFSEVRKIYLDKDFLVDDKKRDLLIKHLFKIQNNVSLYQARRYNEFIRSTEYKISSVQDKERLKEAIQELAESCADMTIEEVINRADENGICKKDDKIMGFISNSTYIYNRVKNIKFSEFQRLYNYLEGYTPHSTQHKTKGAEFDNVLVILDNGDWNNYNFEGLFADSGADSVKDRTRKIFYVCCTRAKEKLAVFFDAPPATVIAKAKLWFGEGNVIEVL